MPSKPTMFIFHRAQVTAQMHLKLENTLGKNTQDLPSERASQTWSVVTFSALREIAMFWAFFGSSTLFSWFGEGRTGRPVDSFEFDFGASTTNNDSIISSFNLQPTNQIPTLTRRQTN